MFIGTAFFNTKESAVKYYAKQEMDEASVDEYLEEGLIFIGPPKLKDDEQCELDEEGRYWISESVYRNQNSDSTM